MNIDVQSRIEAAIGAPFNRDYMQMINDLVGLARELAVERDALVEAAEAKLAALRTAMEDEI